MEIMQWNTFITDFAALDMETTHLKIGNVILPAARLPSEIGGPQIARIEKGSIRIRPLVMY